LEALQRVKRERQGDTNFEPGPGQVVQMTNLGHHWSAGSLLETDPALTAYVTHPRLIGLAEEVMGSEARLTEYNCHINSRDPHAEPQENPVYPFHTGIDVPYGAYTKNGLFHCSFVKTLTNLTDLGPDDGGTVVVAGSHKLDLPDRTLADCADEDRSLIHQVVAPAGSTLLFSETLIHGTGVIRSDRERAIIITGYGPLMFPYWDGGEMSQGFIASIPAHLRNFILGKAHWTRGERYRTLDEPADARRFTLADGWWPNKA
jgi:hypothetical protein